MVTATYVIVLTLSLEATASSHAVQVMFWCFMQETLTSCRKTLYFKRLSRRFCFLIFEKIPKVIALGSC